MIYALTTPIEIAGNEVTELDLKEERLDTKLIKRLGFPFTVGADLTPAPRPSVCADYISRLAAISPSEVEKLSPRDFMAICWALISFSGSRRARRLRTSRSGFDVAYGWRISPDEALALPLSELLLYVEQWNRIQERLKET